MQSKARWGAVLLAGLAACGGGSAEQGAASAQASGSAGASAPAVAPDRASPVPAGEAAPAFMLEDQSGRVRTLSEFRGHPVVLYFYPRDATPGCTREACAFRDAWARYEQAGAVVLGASTDDVISHRRFAEEHHLPFPLLADLDGRVARQFGVGVTMGFASRITFLIDGEGVVRRVFESVDPGVHADEVLAAIAALPAPAAH